MVSTGPGPHQALSGRDGNSCPAWGTHLPLTAQVLSKSKSLFRCWQPNVPLSLPRALLYSLDTGN